MAGQTSRFEFTTLDKASDSLAYRDYKFTDADRVLLDRLLTYVVERHTHSGEATGQGEPLPSPPKVTPFTTGGRIPANTAVHYRTALVDDRGQEHAASQIATIYTNPPVRSPNAFFIGAGPGVPGGTLVPGEYMYAITAYTNNSTSETLPSPPASGRLDAIGNFSLFLPPPPSGTTGYNIYRKGPTERDLLWCGSTPVTDPMPPAWTDTGSNTKTNPNRPLPTANTTWTTSSALVEPAVPIAAGYTLKIYRTYDVTDWDRSLLVWTAVTPIIDTGHATQRGAPATVTSAVAGAPKVDLGREAQGAPPPGLVPTTTTVTFSFPGPVTVGDATWQWINEFDHARVLSIRASLGRGYAPATRPVRVVLEWRTPNADAWHRYQANGITDYTADIPVGQQAGASVPLALYTTPGSHLVPGSAIRPVIIQNGGGATPTDLDLLVSVTLAVRHGSDTQTYTWET